MESAVDPPSPEAANRGVIAAWLSRVLPKGAPSKSKNDYMLGASSVRPVELEYEHHRY